VTAEQCNVGGIYENCDDCNPNSGCARHGFQRTPESVLDLNTADAGFGSDVAISGNYAVVGADGAGKAFIFTHTQ
tara:strand:+ start:95 stop:319 length:225 start_codon:yes stop_codon:yes gene_type:complete